MKILSFIVIINILTSCNNYSPLQKEQIFHLKLTHIDYTGCLDAEIVDRNFIYPNKIAKYLPDSSDTYYRNIILEGKNPFKKVSDIFEDKYSKEYYNVTGYFTGVDSINNGVGCVAVFHIINAEKAEDPQTIQGYSK